MCEFLSVFVCSLILVMNLFLVTFVPLLFTKSPALDVIPLTRYVGKTTLNLTTTIKEHTTGGKNSHNFKHFQNPSDCNSQYSETCFEILDFTNCPYTLKFKEALHFNKLKPYLNKQVNNVNTYFRL